MCVFLSSPHAAETSSQVTAVVLPARHDIQGQIVISPRKLKLSKNENTKFQVTNHSGSEAIINVELEETASQHCKLVYTPKSVSLEDGQSQTFRMYYTADGAEKCLTTFRLRIRLEEEDASVDVDCD